MNTDYYKKKNLEPVRDGKSLDDIIRREVAFVRGVYEEISASEPTRTEEFETKRTSASEISQTWLRITPAPPLYAEELKTLEDELNIRIFASGEDIQIDIF